MSEQMIPVLNVNGYMKKYAVDGIGKGADRWQVRRDMLDEFRREIFNLAMSSVGPQIFSNEWEGSEEDRKKLENIIDNANKKWRSVCREFEKYRETCGLLKETDLQDYLNERMSLFEDADEKDISEDSEEKALEDLKEDVTHETTETE